MSETARIFPPEFKQAAPEAIEQLMKVAAQAGEQRPPLPPPHARLSEAVKDTASEVCASIKAARAQLDELERQMLASAAGMQAALVHYFDVAAAFGQRAAELQVTVAQAVTRHADLVQPNPIEARS